MTGFSAISSDFSINGIIGRVKRSNVLLDDFDAALYTQKLYQVYGEADAVLQAVVTMVTREDGKQESVIQPEALSRPHVQAALKIFQAIDNFTKVAPRVTECYAPGFAWATSKGTPEDVDNTFRFWLGDPALQGAIQDALDELDNPNGVEAGILTPEQRKDPLSGSAGSSSGTDSSGT